MGAWRDWPDRTVPCEQRGPRLDVFVPAKRPGYVCDALVPVAVASRLYFGHRDLARHGGQCVFRQLVRRLHVPHRPVWCDVPELYVVSCGDVLWRLDIRHDDQHVHRVPCGEVFAVAWSVEHPDVFGLPCWLLVRCGQCECWRHHSQLFGGYVQPVVESDICRFLFAVSVWQLLSCSQYNVFELFCGQVSTFVERHITWLVHDMPDWSVLPLGLSVVP